MESVHELEEILQQILRGEAEPAAVNHTSQAFQGLTSKVLNSSLVWKCLTIWFSGFVNVWVAKTEILSPSVIQSCLFLAGQSSASSVIFNIQILHCPFTCTGVLFIPKKSKYSPKNIDKISQSPQNFIIEMLDLICLWKQGPLSCFHSNLTSVFGQKNWSQLNWSCSLLRFEMGINSSKRMLIWFRSVFLCMGFLMSRLLNSLLLPHAEPEFFHWFHWDNYPIISIGRDKPFNRCSGQYRASGVFWIAEVIQK